MSMEEGSATIIVSLHNSTLVVSHGDTHEILHTRPARKGDWDRIWAVLDPTPKGKGTH